MKLNLKKLGDSLFSTDLEKVVNEYPYLSFFILSAIMEFIGKCYLQPDDFQKYPPQYPPVEDFKAVICNFDSFKDYKGTQFEKLIYESVRCGMLHAAYPKNGILLGPDKNDFTKKILGAKAFYQDLKNAWEELKAMHDQKKYIESVDTTEIIANITGVTFEKQVMFGK